MSPVVIAAGAYALSLGAVAVFAGRALRERRRAAPEFTEDEGEPVTNWRDAIPSQAVELDKLSTLRQIREADMRAAEFAKNGGKP